MTAANQPARGRQAPPPPPTQTILRDEYSGPYDGSKVVQAMIEVGIDVPEEYVRWLSRLIRGVHAEYNRAIVLKYVKACLNSDGRTVKQMTPAEMKQWCKDFCWELATANSDYDAGPGRLERQKKDLETKRARVEQKFDELMARVPQPQARPQGAESAQRTWLQSGWFPWFVAGGGLGDELREWVGAFSRWLRGHSDVNLLEMTPEQRQALREHGGGVIRTAGRVIGATWLILVLLLSAVSGGQFLLSAVVVSLLFLAVAGWLWTRFVHAVTRGAARFLPFLDRKGWRRKVERACVTVMELIGLDTWAEIEGLDVMTKFTQAVDLLLRREGFAYARFDEDTPRMVIETIKLGVADEGVIAQQSTASNQESRVGLGLEQILVDLERFLGGGE